MVKINFRQRLAEAHRQESGALLLLCLAGIIILLMLGMLIFDAAQTAEEKVHIQASADASAYSQASVMARTMNTVAFANVGKRINIGYVTAYDATMAWMQWLVGAGWVLTIVCAVIGSLVPGAQAILPVCKTLAKVTLAATCVYGLEEALDRQRHWVGDDGVVRTTFGPEVRSFNNYQQYMADITPYWAWTEGVWRGFVNRAPITLGYPAPKDGGAFEAKLPIEPHPSHKWDEMCKKLNHTPSMSRMFNSIGSVGPEGKGADSLLDVITEQADRWYIYFDFLLKNIISIAAGNYKSTDELPDDFDYGEADVDGDVESEEFAMSCLDLEGLANENEDMEITLPKECDRDPEGNLIDEDCEDEEGTFTMDGKEFDLGMDCISDELKDELMDAVGDAIDDAADCNKIDAIGTYGSVFLAGTLAILVDPGEIAKSKGGFIGGLIAKLMPDGFPKRCGNQARDRMGEYAADGSAWEVDTQDYAMQSSALIFAYRPNEAKNRGMRDKYQYSLAPEDADHGFMASGSSGVWAMSRGELTWQGGDDYSAGPNLWESMWGSRLRPVALPGEWEDYGDFTPYHALREIEVEMFAAILIAHGADFLSPEAAGQLITNKYDINSMASWDVLEELLSTKRSFEPMSDERMEGLVK